MLGRAMIAALCPHVLVGPPDAILAGRFSFMAGFGLFSIRERVEHLGGRLRLKRTPQGRTVAEVVQPLTLEVPPSEQL